MPTGAVWSSAGAVAQLGERLLCKQEVIGSIPFGSTSSTHEFYAVVLWPLEKEEKLRATIGGFGLRFCSLAV
jgi:hypothetical protein